MGFSCKFSRENQSIDLWAPWEILPWPGVSCSERLVVDVRGHVNWHRDEVGLLGGAASRFSHWDSQFWLGKTHGKMNRFWWMMTGWWLEVSFFLRNQNGWPLKASHLQIIPTQLHRRNWISAAEKSVTFFWATNRWNTSNFIQASWDLPSCTS